MRYLQKFNLLSDYTEHGIAMDTTLRKFSNNYYPLGIFPNKELECLKFGDITCFYGGNGSGKSTLLNIIASKLNAVRLSPFEKGSYFDEYVSNCDATLAFEKPAEIKIISSDDIFENIRRVRVNNMDFCRKEGSLAGEYVHYKFTREEIAFNDYDGNKKSYDAKHQKMHEYIRPRLNQNTLEEYSNGETALAFWEKEIKENAVYLLDEPENSLSSENQLKLKSFIEDSVRFYNCQFIISTHSPFLLSLREACIYNLDSNTGKCFRWTELPGVQTYYNFFKENEDLFSNKHE